MRLPWIAIVGGVVLMAPARAEEPAADGTQSVVVPAEPPATPGQSSVLVPPTEPANAPPAATTAEPAAQTVAPPPTQPAAGLATDVLAQSLEPLAGRPGATNSDAALYARPLPLLEALDRSGDRARRLWITQAYWKVAAAFAAVRWSTEAIERLDLVAPGGDPHDRATLDVATAAARADLADARAQLGAAQQELVDLAKLPVTDPLPWPVDRPLAIPYQTHFEAIFANRPATGRVRAIARTLPARHEAIEARAAAVRAAEKAATMAEADHAQGKRPIEAVIAAHAALVGQQREFLQATKAYNLDIAEYAMAAADLSIPDDRFAAMLIGAPIQWRQPAVPGGATGGQPTRE
jgi:outer membrane protein TolC